MGVSAGGVAVDDGESTGINVRKLGESLDDDEGLLWDSEDQGGRGLLGRDLPEYQQAIGEVRVIEQVRQDLAHQRHSRLRARQEGSSLLSGAADTVGEIVNTVVSKVSDIVEVSSYGPIVSSTPIISADSSTLSIVLSSRLAVSSASVQTGITSDVPIRTTLQTLLSSTPPPSPAVTSAGMTIPPITSTSSVSLTITTQPPSQDTGSTHTRLYKTVTSYWTSPKLRNNGTAQSNTNTASSSFASAASTVTLDGTVVVFTYPTNISSNNGNSSTQSTISSVLSSSSLSSSNSTTTSTTSSDSLATSLWSSATGVAGGGGWYVAPTNSTAASTAPVSTSASVSSTSNSPPVSPRLLGGVLGGVAGLALVLVAILYMVRRRKRELVAQRMDEAGYGGPLEGGGADQMTQNPSIAPFTLRSFFARHSQQSRTTTSQSPEAAVPSAEVGFYRVSGRKLPPVIGGPRPGYGSTPSAEGSSVYPDDDAITVASTPSVAGPSRYSSMTAASASPTSLTAPMTFVTPLPTPISSAHPPYIGPTMAPPPPRIPEEASESDTGSTQNLPWPLPFPRQLSTISVGSAGKDGVGRSLPSHDGSRTSRFTEDV